MAGDWREGEAMKELNKEKSGGNAMISPGGLVSSAHERMGQETHARSDETARMQALEGMISFLKAELRFREAELFEREREIAELRMELVTMVRPIV